MDWEELPKKPWLSSIVAALHWCAPSERTAAEAFILPVESPLGRRRRSSTSAAPWRRCCVCTNSGAAADSSAAGAARIFAECPKHGENPSLRAANFG